MSLHHLPLGIRATSTASFAVLALSVSVVLATGTYLTARHYLVGQRETTAGRQAFVDDYKRRTDAVRAMYTEVME